jgi:hypothetical protein
MKKILSILFTSILLFATDAAAQKDRVISEVQGEKNTSPLVGESVRLTGIVTARRWSFRRLRRAFLHIFQARQSRFCSSRWRLKR